MSLNTAHLDAIVDLALELEHGVRSSALMLLTEAVVWAAGRFARADLIAPMLTLAIDHLTGLRDEVARGARRGRQS